MEVYRFGEVFVDTCVFKGIDYIRIYLEWLCYFKVFCMMCFGFCVNFLDFVFLSLFGFFVIIG